MVWRWEESKRKPNMEGKDCTSIRPWEAAKWKDENKVRTKAARVSSCRNIGISYSEVDL